MRAFWIISVMLLLAFQVKSQQGVGVLKGLAVSDVNVGNLPDVQVVIKSTSLAAVTDSRGRFLIANVPAGQFTIEVLSSGYETVTADVLIKAGEETSVRLRLSDQVIEMPQITILEDRKGIFSTVPGSVTCIDKKQFNRIDPISGNEVLWRIPGLHVLDEEGAGMRVNGGIRGLDSDRSRGVFVLEDGVPVALSPCGEPEIYQTTAISGMARVEVIKGSGSILNGPQTVGGVVN